MSGHPFDVVIPPDKGDENHEPGVRLARCDNVSEPEGIPCRGLLAFQPGDRQAACSRCQAWCGVQVADYLNTPDAPREPHAPATAPNTPPRGSADGGDGSESLRDALAVANTVVEIRDAVEEGMGHTVYVATGGEPEECTDDCPACIALDGLDGLLPLVLAYGREQATRALRDAAAHFASERARVDAEPAPYPEASAYRDGRSNAYEFAADEMTERADELGRQT